MNETCLRKWAGGRALHAAVLIFCLVLTGYLLVLISRAAVNVPFKDEFSFAELFSALARGKLPAVSEIVAAHNGHPYLALKLLMSATLALHMPWSWMMYAQVPILAICVLIIYRRALATSANPAVSVVSAAIVLLSPRHWENFYWAMQIAFALALAAGLGAFYLAAKFEQERKPSQLVGALALGLLGSICAAPGFVAFAITVFVLMAQRLRRDQYWIVVGIGILGLGFFIIAQMLAIRGGVGQNHLELRSLAEHLLLMLSNTVAFFGEKERFIALSIGVAIASLTIYCFYIAIRAWPSAIFELACLALGGVLVIVVTYSRVSMGIFQPDAPRYVPLVAPLIVGSVLILERNRKQCLLYIIVAAVSVGWLQSAVSEWGITPYRKENLERTLYELCVESRVEGRTLSAAQIKDIQLFFCVSR